jgi:uncharacterized membrane protein YphA (DoxX/SURF4 family)
MNVALWAAQLLLAAVFASSGTIKALGSKDWLVASGQTGVSHFSVPFIRFVAISELFGVAGLILPRALNVAPALTPLAAACLGVLMVGAASAHARLARENPGRREKERRNIGTNVVLLGLCLFVALGRGL